MPPKKKQKKDKKSPKQNKVSVPKTDKLPTYLVQPTPPMENNMAANSSHVQPQQLQGYNNMMPMPNNNHYMNGYPQPPAFQYPQSASPSFNHQMSSPNGHMPDQPPEWAKTLISKVDTLTSKLNKLDTIANSVNGLHDDFQMLQIRVGELEKSQKFLSDHYDKEKKSTTKKTNDIDDLKSVVNKLEGNNKDLCDTILDLQSRSMRDNLLFMGVPEVSAMEEEDCCDFVQTFGAEKLNIHEEIHIDRAHRIGRKIEGKCRPIVAKFSQYKQRETVRLNASKLKDSPIYVRQQFPKAIIDARKVLQPTFDKAKNDGKYVYFVKDKLYIDKKIFTGKPVAAAKNN